MVQISYALNCGDCFHTDTFETTQDSVRKKVYPEYFFESEIRRIAGPSYFTQINLSYSQQGILNP